MYTSKSCDSGDDSRRKRRKTLNSGPSYLSNAGKSSGEGCFRWEHERMRSRRLLYILPIWANSPKPFVRQESRTKLNESSMEGITDLRYNSTYGLCWLGGFHTILALSHLSKQSPKMTVPCRAITHTVACGCQTLRKLQVYPLQNQNYPYPRYLW